MIHSPNLVIYLLVGGDLAVKHDKFVTMSGRCIDLRIYVEPKDLIESITH